MLTSWRSLILDLAPYFDGHGVPSIKHAIVSLNEKAKQAVIAHPDFKLIPTEIEILWINPFVVPEIFFCLQDATDQKLDQYFSPIILTNNENEIGKIREIHSTFHEYYQKDVETRKKDMVVLTDLGIVGISDFEIIDNRSVRKYWSNIASLNCADQFKKYVNLVTNNGNWQYCVYRIGLSDVHATMGNVYVGFKVVNNKDPELNENTKNLIKCICFDLLSAFVLAGVLKRNKIVMGMLKDFGQLMRAFDGHVFRHRDLLVNLGMDRMEARRQELIRLIETLQLSHIEWRVLYASHIATCPSCQNSTQDLSHQTTSCRPLRDIFLNEINTLLIQFLRQEYSGTCTPPNGWKIAIYAIYGKRNEVLDNDDENNIVSLIPRVGNIPRKHAAQDLQSMLQTLAFLLSNINMVDGNFEKILENGWRRQKFPEINIMYQEPEICVISVIWKLEKCQLISSSIKNKTIGIDPAKIKDDSLTNIIALASLFFKSIRCEVRTKVNSDTVKAVYSNSGDELSALMPEVLDMRCGYHLVLKP